MKNKVSILLPVYNAEATIGKTIESVINQTYNNIELIIVSDGSSDRTNRICEKYEKKSKKIRFFVKENTGVSRTRNFALNQAIGKYIMFVDSDDLYCKDYVENMVKTLEKENTSLVICGYKRINYEKHKEVKKQMPNKKYNQTEFDLLIKAGQNKNLFNQIWNKIYIKKIIDEKKITFEEDLSLGEDFRFVLSYLSFAKSVYMLEKCLYLYTNSTDGLNNKYRKNRLDINIENLKLLENYFIDNKYDLKYIDKKYIITIASGIKNICSNPEKKEIKGELIRFKKNKFVVEKLNKKISFKYNVISFIIKNSGILLLKLYGKLFILYDRLYKKKKLGY